MNTNYITIETRNFFLKLFCFVIVMIGLNSITKAQAITFTSIQDLNFGTFLSSGSGGTLTISNTSVRSATGNVIPVLSSTFSPAVFSVYAGNIARTLRSLSYSTSVTLTRIGGGGTMMVTLNAYTPTIPGNGTPLKKFKSLEYTIGGKLTVGTLTANPGGVYTGSFTVTLNYN